MIQLDILMKRFFIFLNIVLIFFVIAVIDLSESDQTIYSFFINFLNSSKGLHSYDLPFWESSVVVGTIIASYFALKNIILIQNAEELKHMPVLRIKEGVFTGIDDISLGNAIVVVNVGKDIALKTHLYLCKGKKQAIIEGMIDIGVGETSRLNAGDYEKSIRILEIMESDVQNQYKNLFLYIKYEDIFGNEYASIIPKGHLQIKPVNLIGDHLPNIQILRSGWKFLGRVQ